MGCLVNLAILAIVVGFSVLFGVSVEASKDLAALAVLLFCLAAGFRSALRDGRKR
jgi:diacylglycerol kinase